MSILEMQREVEREATHAYIIARNRLRIARFLRYAVVDFVNDNRVVR